MNWLKAINEMKLPPLVSGSHTGGPEEGLCAMEMVAYMERLEHNDHPECTCKVLRGLTVCINDLLSDTERQKLLPVLPELVDTVVGPGKMQERDNHIMRTASRTFDFYNRQDYERDRFRGHYPHSRSHHEFEHYMREGVQGAIRVIMQVTPPWQVADVLIGLLRECIKIGSATPKTEFKKKTRVKELAEVVYMPTLNAKTKMVEQLMKIPYNMAVIDPKKAFMSIDCAV